MSRQRDGRGWAVDTPADSLESAAALLAALQTAWKLSATALPWLLGCRLLQQQLLLLHTLLLLLLAPPLLMQLLLLHNLLLLRTLQRTLLLALLALLVLLLLLARLLPTPLLKARPAVLLILLLQLLRLLPLLHSAVVGHSGWRHPGSSRVGACLPCRLASCLSEQLLPAVAAAVLRPGAALAAQPLNPLLTLLALQCSERSRGGGADSSIRGEGSKRESRLPGVRR